MEPLEQSDLEDIGDTVSWAMAEAVAEAVDLSAVSISLSIAQLLYDVYGELDGYDPSVPPNPKFLQHGFDNPASPRSSKYMKTRTYKKVGSAAVATAGGLASTATVVDVDGILRHGNATGSTLVHLKFLYEISKRYPRSKTIQHWLDVCMKCKLMKAGVRGGQMVTAAIPVGPVGIASSAVAGLAKIGVAVTMAGVVNRVAQEIHWRANVEMRLGGSSRFGGNSSKPNGPVSAVYFEIFRRRGATRVFGQYDVPAMISGSGGWVPLRDKLMLM